MNVYADIIAAAGSYSALYRIQATGPDLDAEFRVVVLYDEAGSPDAHISAMKAGLLEADGVTSVVAQRETGAVSVIS